jgi:hypothetical protein
VSPSLQHGAAAQQPWLPTTGCGSVSAASIIYPGHSVWAAQVGLMILVCTDC